MYYVLVSCVECLSLFEFQQFMCLDSWLNFSAAFVLPFDWTMEQLSDGPTDGQSNLIRGSARQGGLFCLNTHGHMSECCHEFQWKDKNVSEINSFKFTES